MAKNFFLRNRTRIVKGLALLLIISVLYGLVARNILTKEGLKQFTVYLEDLVRQNFVSAALLYVVAFTGVVAFLLPGVVLMTLAGGYLFGTIWGFFLAMAGICVGTVAVFLMTRYLLREYVRRRYGRQLAAFNAELEKFGPNYLISLQLLPFTPTFLINIFSGVTQVSCFTFLWTTAVGIMPQTLFYAYVGNELEIFTVDHISFMWPIFILLCALAFAAAWPILHSRVFKKNGPAGGASRPE